MLAATCDVGAADTAFVTTTLTPLELLQLILVTAHLQTLDGAEVWPDPARTGTWSDPRSGTSWRRRGTEQSVKRLQTLLKREQVPVIVLYAFELREVLGELRLQASATMREYWHSSSSFQSVDGAEFVDDDGQHLVILQVSC